METSKVQLCRVNLWLQGLEAMSRSFPVERKTAYRQNKMGEDKSGKILTHGVTIHATIKVANRFRLVSNPSWCSRL